MVKKIIKRLIISAFILLAFSFILYGSIVLMLMLLRGISLSFFASYFTWLRNILRGDLGFSFLFQQPVSTAILEHIGISAFIMFLGLTIAYLIAIPLGIKCATKQNSKFDIVSSTLVLISTAFPAFFIAAIIIHFLAIQLGLFPSFGLISGNLPEGTSNTVIFFNRIWHLILPVFTIAILNIGTLARHTKANLLEVLDSDYIRTARAMGVKEKTVINKFALKNTAIPLSTFMASVLPTIFAGTMFVEIVFSLPGIGFAAFRALMAGDFNFVMGFNLFLAMLTILGVLLSDIVYIIVNPKIKTA
ncbi:MAG: ABC transporter permease [Defluviitaleaceae bacterium]|nr:ABC transporter permease [Defluviitaleaceae bacterium]